jgi:hopene-associated glycosyltransferase HpnB
MTVLAALVCGIWAYLLLAHGRFWQSGPVLPAAAPHIAPPVAVIVPARNEAESVAATVRSLLAQRYAGKLRVIVVDDGSTDGTGDIVRALADPRLTLVTGAPRPAGWAGKLWAVAQGIEEAGDADLLLLTDADIVHDPRHVATLVAQQARGGYDLVSEMVRLACASPAERALVPAFVFFFQMLYPFAWVADPARTTAAAAGGTMLVRRAALEAAGGIAAMRAALIDDVALAALLKARGRIWLGHSGLADSIRPYPDARAVWRMIARSAYVQLRHSLALLALTVLGMTMIWLAPPALALFAHGAARWLGLAAWAAGAAAFLPTLARFRLSPAWALTLPAVAAFYMAATIGSALDHLRGRGVVWKDRAYQGAGA